MNMLDIRRTVLWVIFGFSLVLLWDQWQVYNGNKPTFLPSAHPPVAAKAPAAGAAPAAGTPAAAAGNAAPGAVPTQGTTAVASQKFDVTTDLFKASIDSQGATLAGLQLRKFDDETNNGGLVESVRKLFGYPVPPNEVKPVTLMEDGSPATRYVAQTGLLNAANPSERFPDQFTQMTAKPGPRELAEGQNTLEVAFESQPVNGIKYLKTYVFTRGDYSIRVKHEIVNVSDQPRDTQLYLQLLRHGTVAAGTMFGTNTFAGPAAYTNEKKFHKIDFKDIAKGKAEVPPPADNGWIAMVQHYFASAWLLQGDGSAALQREFRVRDLGDNLFSIAMVANVLNIQWVKDALNNPARVICPRSNRCPRPERCEGAKPSRAREITDVRAEVIASVEVGS
jgi:YidC/Oxa1 family membrane protein insertase